QSAQHEKTLRVGFLTVDMVTCLVYAVWSIERVFDMLGEGPDLPDGRGICRRGTAVERPAFDQAPLSLVQGHSGSVVAEVPCHGKDPSARLSYPPARRAAGRGAASAGCQPPGHR